MNNVAATTAARPEKITTERRSIYNSYGRGKRVSYDARGTTVDGIEYNVSAPTKAEAIEQACREIAFMRDAGSFEAGGCSVRAVGFESWSFSLPGRSVMVYGARDLAAAVDYAAWSYREHEEAQVFYGAVCAVARLVADLHEVFAAVVA